MEEVWQKFEKWYASFSSDANVITKKGFAANAFEAGYKSAQQGVQRTALQVRILNAICYGMTAGSLLWLLFGSR